MLTCILLFMVGLKLELGTAYLLCSLLQRFFVVSSSA